MVRASGLTFPRFQLFPDEDLESLLDKIDVIDHGAGSVDKNVDIALQDRAEDLARALTQPDHAPLDPTQRRLDSPFVLPVLLRRHVHVGDAAVAPGDMREGAVGTIRGVDYLVLPEGPETSVMKFLCFLRLIFCAIFLDPNFMVPETAERTINHSNIHSYDSFIRSFIHS